MTYYVIGDEDTVLGLGMAGVRGRAVLTPSEAEAAFDEALAQEDVGILIITEKAADLIRTRVNQYLFSRDFPLIVEIPGREGRHPDRPGLREMVNEAIGINL